jgi:hypothetical protein
MVPPAEPRESLCGTMTRSRWHAPLPINSPMVRECSCHHCCEGAPTAKACAALSYFGPVRRCESLNRTHNCRQLQSHHDQGAVSQWWRAVPQAWSVKDGEGHVLTRFTPAAHLYVERKIVPTYDDALTSAGAWMSERIQNARGHAASVPGRSGNERQKATFHGRSD